LEAGTPMDWIMKMRRDEEELKFLVSRLGKTHGVSLGLRMERARLLKTIGCKLEQMRRNIEDSLTGRNSYEQSLLEYRVRIELPLYSHLGQLSAISPDWADWSCA